MNHLVVITVHELQENHQKPKHITSTYMQFNNKMSALSAFNDALKAMEKYESHPIESRTTVNDNEPSSKT
jgi:hypothetical protein